MYYAKARNYPSALEAALFPDQVPVAVYDNLIASIHRQLARPAPLLRRAAAEDEARPDSPLRHLRADPGGDADPAHLGRGGQDGVDRLEAAGKRIWQRARTGLARPLVRPLRKPRQAERRFSAGSYDGNPYILMNYQPDVLDHVFTLAHEAGHSMHSYFSGKNQPFTYYQYSLFVAEVASTFNEQLLSQYLLTHARDNQERAFLLNRQIDAIRSTIFRQTMFAEFEKLAHASVEAGEPLTLDRIKEIYHGLLKLYFGPDFTLDAELDLECLRMPHFYRAFYVYKYATGMSAAIALVDRVTGGGRQELDDYLGFLKGGCSKDPLGPVARGGRGHGEAGPRR